MLEGVPLWSSVVRTFTFTAFSAEVWVPSLVRELRSHKPSGMTNKTKQKGRK